MNAAFTVLVAGAQPGEIFGGAIEAPVAPFFSTLLKVSAFASGRLKPLFAS